MNKILFTVVMLIVILENFSLNAEEIAPKVEIVSPKSGTTIHEKSINVSVWFSSYKGEESKLLGSVSTVQLLLNGQTVSTYENLSQKENDGINFTADISALPQGQGVAVLQAVVLQGKGKKILKGYSEPVIIIRQTDLNQPCSCNKAHQLSEMQGSHGILYLGVPQEKKQQEETRNSLSSTQAANIVYSLKRYSPKTQVFSTMIDKKAFYRDLWVGLQTDISNATVGDTWYTIVTFPDGTKSTWSKVSLIYDPTNPNNPYCFIFPPPINKVCSSIPSMGIIWYINSQCGPTGNWTFDFYQNDNLIHSEQFELLPRIPPQGYPDSVPLDNQLKYTDPALDIMPSGKTIAKAGCVLTSLAMILSYYGFPTTARELNEYLKRNDRWYEITKTVGIAVALNKKTRNKVVWLGVEKRESHEELEKYICLYGPPYLQFDNVGEWNFHTVVAIGRNNNNWFINDPSGGVERDNLSWKSDYDWVGIIGGVDYTQNRPDVGTAVTIIIKSPGELVITDPLGRKTGYDPISKTEYHEIPGASYFELSLGASPAGTPLDKYINLHIPPEGEYELRVIGTGLGIYDLLISAMDREGGQSGKFIEQMPISPNAIHTYLFNYSREAGSEIEVFGAFDGKGQRPRDVNKFLSYSNPTQVTTELPSGSTTFDILIFYDQPIIPQTFKAELNRQDITNLFSPSAGGFQIVRITLAKGRNTLVLSVDGTLASGRVATDTDRLVFIVP